MFQQHLNTIKTLNSFKLLPKGWHFGEGVPIAEHLFGPAKELIAAASKSKFKTDAFPGIDGDTLITVYHKNHYLEFHLNLDGSVDYSREFNNEEVEYIEELSFSDAKNKLIEFGKEIWTLLESYISGILTSKKEDSLVWPLQTPQVEEYLQFRVSASKKDLDQNRLVISGNTMKKLRMSPQSFGRLNFQKGVNSNLTQVLDGFQIRATVIS